MEQIKKSTTFKKLLMRNVPSSAIAVALAGALMVGSMQAQSASLPLNWSNLDGSGTPGAFILLDKLNTIASPQEYTSFANVGADHILNTGDSFVTDLGLITNSSSLGAGVTSFGLAGDYRIVAHLVGSVTDSSGTPIELHPDNSVSNDASSTFNIAFVSGTTLDLYNNTTNELIANLTFASGGASNVRLLAGSLIGDITINALLGAGCVNCDPYLQTASGDSIVGQDFFTITTGSSRFLSFNGSSYADNALNVNFQNNGQSTTFVPEPGSLALIGLGLLGFGVTRRGKKSI